MHKHHTLYSAVFGGVVGGIGALVIIVIVIICLKKKKKLNVISPIVKRKNLDGVTVRE